MAPSNSHQSFTHSPYASAEASEPAPAASLEPSSQRNGNTRNARNAPAARFTSYPTARPSRPTPRDARTTGRNLSVCLDYVKGICHQKRDRCRFAHPAHLNPHLSKSTQNEVEPTLPRDESAPEGAKVCEVFRLTGFCKFGSQCRDWHPKGLTEPVAAPACTSKMSAEIRDAADAAVTRSIFEEAADAQEAENGVADGGGDGVPFELTQAIAKLASQPDCDVDTICAAVDWTPDTPRTSERVFRLLHAKGVLAAARGSHKGAACAGSLATLAARLLARHDQKGRAAVRTFLSDCVGRLIYQLEDVLSVLLLPDYEAPGAKNDNGNDYEDSEEAQLAALLRPALSRRRMGNCRFFGHLYAQGVLGDSLVNQACDYLCVRGSRVKDEGDEGLLHARLLAGLLEAGGLTLRQIQPSYVGNKVRWLQEAARKHSDAQFETEVEACLLALAVERCGE